MPKLIPPERLAWFQDALFKYGMHASVAVREGMKRWSIKERQCHYMIALARKTWKESGTRDLEQIRAELDGMHRHVYGRALEEGDLKTANMAAKSLAELHGAAAAQKLDVTGTIMGVSMEPAQVRAQIRQAMIERPEYVKGLLEGGESGELESVEIKPAGAVVSPTGGNGHNGTNGTNGAAK